MNSKYIFFLCFAMNYLVVQSVAKNTTDELRGVNVNIFKEIHKAYTKTRKYFKIDAGEELSVDQFMWLMDTDDKSIINNIFTSNEIAAMYKDKISLDEIVKIIKKICKNNRQDILNFTKIINKQLNNKLAAIATAV